MATRNPLALLVVGALSFAGTQRGDAVTIGRPAADPKTPTPAGASVLRIDTRDHQTPGHLEQLRRSSAMARDLLARVGNLRATVLFLRGDPAFVKKSGVYGQSRFWVQNGELLGSIRYQAGPLNSLETKCLIVHELAHAVEMASSDRTAADLREFVLSRAIGPDPSPARAETAFPRRVALAVLAQLRSRSAGGNSLAQIAEVYGITLPPLPVADATALASAH